MGRRVQYIHYFYKSRIKLILNTLFLIAATGSSPITEKLSRNTLCQKGLIDLGKQKKTRRGFVYVIIFFPRNFW